MAVVEAVAVEPGRRVERMEVDRQGREQQERQDERERLRSRAPRDVAGQQRQYRQHDRQERPVHQQHRLGLWKQLLQARGQVESEWPDGSKEIDARHLAEIDPPGGIEIDDGIPGVRAEREAQRQLQGEGGCRGEGRDPRSGRQQQSPGHPAASRPGMSPDLAHHHAEPSWFGPSYARETLPAA